MPTKATAKAPPTAQPSPKANAAPIGQGLYPWQQDNQYWKWQQPNPKGHWDNRQAQPPGGTNKKPRGRKFDEEEEVRSINHQKAYDQMLTIIVVDAVTMRKNLAVQEPEWEEPPRNPSVRAR